MGKGRSRQREPHRQKPQGLRGQGTFGKWGDPARLQGSFPRTLWSH